MVLLPAPESPVNQRTKPLCTPASQNLFEQHVDGPLHSAVGGEVNAALLVGVLFPPPAAGALALSGFDGARARIAANTGIAAPVEWMARDVVPADVVVHLLWGPIGERADLYRRRVRIHLAHIGARIVLRAPQPDCPGFQFPQLPLQRAHFANVAAEHA